MVTVCDRVWVVGVVVRHAGWVLLVVAVFGGGLPVKKWVADAPSGPRSPLCLSTLLCRVRLLLLLLCRRGGLLVWGVWGLLRYGWLI